MGCGKSEPEVKKTTETTEAGAAQPKSEFKVSDRKKLQEVFDKIDASKSGKLSKSELMNAFKALEINVSEDDLNAVISLVDQNSDSELNFAEFYHLVYICSNVKSGEREKTVFLVADADCSGSINAAELGALFKKLGIDVDKAELEAEIKKVAPSGNVSYSQFSAVIKNVSTK